MIKDRVWDRHRSVLEEGDEWRLAFLARGDRDELLPVIEAAIAGIIDAQDVLAEHDYAHEPGGWLVRAVPEGVGLEVDECPAFVVMLRALDAAVERSGTSVVFDLVPDSWWPRPDPIVDNLCCLMRVRADLPSERRRLMEAVTASWCEADAPAGQRVAFDVGFDTFVPLDHGSLAEWRWSHALSVRPDGRREALSEGPFGLISVPDAAHCASWETIVADFSRILREHADLFLYAHIRRAYSIVEGADPMRVAAYSPERPSSLPPSGYAPDVFGVQLLGPDLAARAPDHPDWTVEPLEDGSALVSAKDLEPWYESRPAQQPPRGLEAGRRAFGGLLPPGYFADWDVG